MIKEHTETEYRFKKYTKKNIITMPTTALATLAFLRRTVITMFFYSYYVLFLCTSNSHLFGSHSVLCLFLYFLNTAVKPVFKIRNCMFRSVFLKNSSLHFNRDFFPTGGHCRSRK
jgi:hypothetical protein